MQIDYRFFQDIILIITHFLNTCDGTRLPTAREFYASKNTDLLTLFFTEGLVTTDWLVSNDQWMIMCRAVRIVTSFDLEVVNKLTS